MISVVLTQRSSVAIRPNVVLADLDTDWAPDPWGWRDLPDRAVDVSTVVDQAVTEPLHRLLVPFVGGRRREVPLLGFATRLLFTGCAASLVGSRQRQLSDGVFGYRVDMTGQFVPYREELARRREYERNLKERSRVSVSADLRRFFRSVTIDHILGPVPDASADSSRELDLVLDRFHDEFGYVLPEGYAAARGLANLALVAVDRRIDVPFTRWLDDYRLFCQDKAEAQRGLRELRLAVADAGFDLAEDKTRIGPAAAQRPGADASLGDHSEDSLSPGALLRLLGLECADPGELDRKGRFALRTAAETHDVDAVQALLDGGVDKVRPAWLPRVAWLISACPTSPASAALLSSLWHIEDEFTGWRRLRLAPALWYLPTYITSDLDIVGVCDELRPARPALTRVLARHRPDQLNRLPQPSCDDERRSRRLGEVEAGTRPPATSLEAEAVRTGPPVASFL